MIEVQLEGSEIFDLLKDGDKQLEKAIYFAKNRALQTARTEMLKSAAKTYDTTQKQIRERMNLKKSEGELEVKGSPIRLFKFKVTPTSPRQQIVVASVKRANKTLPRAFVQQMPNGTIGVFQRVGKKRYPIEQLYSVSAPQMAGEDSIIEKAVERASIVFDDRLEHEIERIGL